jgi:hypothetical protein
MALIFTEIDATIALSPGASIDEPMLSEIKANFLDIDAGRPQMGTGTLSGMVGTPITIDDMGTADYAVNISVRGRPDGTVGEIGYEIDSNTQFTVFNTGSSTNIFSWTASA